VLSISIIVVIAMMMGAASTSETLGNFYQSTWGNIPEDSQYKYHVHCSSGSKLLVGGSVFRMAFSKTVASAQ
jgi:hypothetical protein